MSGSIVTSGLSLDYCLCLLTFIFCMIKNSPLFTVMSITGTYPAPESHSNCSGRKLVLARRWVTVKECLNTFKTSTTARNWTSCAVFYLSLVPSREGVFLAEVIEFENSMDFNILFEKKNEFI